MLKQQYNTMVATGKQMEKNLPYNKKNAEHYLKIVKDAEEKIEKQKEECRAMKATIDEIEKQQEAKGAIDG